ncbi:MAG: hypothetical protein ABL907_25815 [Hyphomicrobium sp.]
MTTKALTLAALMLATSTFSNAAEAGGVRLQFGGPLGSFVAHPTMSSGPGGTMKNQHCAKESRPSQSYSRPSYLGRRPHDDPPARKVAVHHKAPKAEVAEAPAPRRIKKTPRVELAEQAPVVRKIHKPAVIRTAKLTDNSIVSDAAPSIYVPESPAPVAEFSGTQSTPAVQRATADAGATTTVAGLEPEAKTEVVVMPVVDETPAPVATVAKAEKSAKSEKSGAIAAKICRRFSAAIAGLITVPCD